MESPAPVPTPEILPVPSPAPVPDVVPSPPPVPVLIETGSNITTYLIIGLCVVIVGVALYKMSKGKTVSVK